MLQKLLGNHVDIHTTGEPWLMLPLVYMLQPSMTAPYDTQMGQGAIHQFIRMLPQGVATYDESVRRMATYLYDQALASNDKKLFLDKTPRYYLIISELARLFPRARFVILLRNPLAVLSSVVRTWVRSRPKRLASYQQDLLVAPRRLLQGIDTLGSRCTVTRYEQLVSRPDRELASICSALGVPFDSGLVEYSGGNQQHWKFGDQTLAQQEHRPLEGNADRWLEDIEKPDIWRLAHEYLARLGPQVVESMGYDYDKMSDQLAQRRPNWRSRMAILPFSGRVGRMRFRETLHKSRTKRNTSDASVQATDSVDRWHRNAS